MHTMPTKRKRTYKPLPPGNPARMTHTLHVYVHTKRMGDSTAVRLQAARNRRKGR